MEGYWTDTNKEIILIHASVRCLRPGKVLTKNLSSWFQNRILRSFPSDPILSLLTLALRHVPEGHENKISVSVSVPFEMLMSSSAGGRDSAYSDRISPTFRAKVLPPPFGSKSNTNIKQSSVSARF
jgi:hypothetical protein